MTGIHVSTPMFILAATLASAVTMWLVVSRFGTKRRGQLVTFFLIVAGTGSALLSLRYQQWAWFIFVASVLAAVLLWFLFHKLGKNLRPTTFTWGQYLRGQGALLLFFFREGFLKGVNWSSLRIWILASILFTKRWTSRTTRKLASSPRLSRRRTAPP